MSAKIACPYVGLRPFKAADRRFFFGRDRDIRVIASNLRARRLTVLYGASGVGKSSVLQAGLIPYLEGPATRAIYFNRWQGAGFHAELLKECQRVLENNEEGLEGLLAGSGRQVILMLDQFEEFLLYQGASTAGDAFVELLARVATRDDLQVNVLIGIREEALSLMDKRLSVRISNLFANTLVLGHLRQDDARLAIRKPLDVLRESGAGEFTIEDELVERLLRDVQTGRIESGDVAVGVRHKNAASGSIETTFLQLVLKRLWDMEIRRGSTVLHAATLKDIGGATRIVQRHVEEVMALLDAAQQTIAAKLFRYLVTPSRTKIAQRAGDLVAYAEAPEAEVRPVLLALSHGQEVRILRELPTPERYELFHDVLAQPVLDWVARFNEEQKRQVVEQERAEELEQERQKAERERQRADQERRAAEQARQLAESAQQLEANARQLAEAEKLRANQQEEYARRSRAMSLGLVGLLVLSMGALGYAVYRQFETSETSKILSETNEKLTEKNTVLAAQETRLKLQAAELARSRAREQQLAEQYRLQGDEWIAKLKENAAAKAKAEGEAKKAALLEAEANQLRHCTSRAPLPFTITVGLIKSVMPDSRRPDQWITPLTTAMVRCEVNTPQRAAMFLAQIAYESNQLNQTEESMKYSAEALTGIWPSRFPSPAQAQVYVGNPPALANFVYANRLGNGDANSGDGWRYRGRGLIFITGRGNYKSMGGPLRRPFEANPELVAQPNDAALTAAYFWASRGLNSIADANSEGAFLEATRIINGGTASRGDRGPYWARAKTALQIGSRPQEVQSPPPRATPLEQLISLAEAVDSVQTPEPYMLQSVRSQMLSLLRVEVPDKAWTTAVDAQHVSGLVQRAEKPTLAPTFVGVVARLLKTHLADGLFVSGEKKDRKVTNALKARKTSSPRAEQVLGVLDPTVLGGTDVHLLFTDEGVYFRASALRTSGDKEGYLPYTEFPKLTFSRCKSYTVCFGPGTEFSLAGSRYEEQQLIALLDDLKSAVLLGLEQ